jgi:hypothetical protein
LGSFDLSLFLSRLEEHRDFAHAKLAGMRIAWSPFSFLELGVSRVALFDGEGRHAFRSISDYWTLVTASKENTGSELDNDQIASFDATLRLRDLDRYLPLASSLVLYGEYGGEDMAGEKSGVPFPYKAGVIGGILLQDLFTMQGLDLRTEYARTHKTWYTHYIYTSGYTYKGVILGHHMGGDAHDVYFRLSHWLNKNLQVALDFDQQQAGRSRSVRIRERYLEPSLLLFRPRGIPLSALLAYRFVRTKNAGFQEGEDRSNHLLRLDLSYQF